jgi:ABC-type dipeptide/oligopeptide/nickel transport system permease subunit
MAIVFGLFADKAAADQAADALRRADDSHPTFAVQSHERSPLDGNYLPEAATEIGRNTLIAVIVGAIVGLVLGVTASMVLDIGLTLGIGAAFGLLTGVLSGMLGGMMAGTRLPKLPLREVAERLGEGRVLLTVEVDEARHVELVETLLETHEGSFIDNC